MESYVIRIYRREDGEPQRIVGLVEFPESGVTERFGHMTELMGILLSPHGAGIKAAANGKGGDHKDMALTADADEVDEEDLKLFRYRSK